MVSWLEMQGNNVGRSTNKSLESEYKLAIALLCFGERSSYIEDWESMGLNKEKEILCKWGENF